MAVHVFWDNSNIWIGLQHLCEQRENIPSTALRVYLKNLDDFIVQGRKTVTKVISGSYPPECEDLLTTARELGYETRFFHKINDGERNREQGVDPSLHLYMSRCINYGKEREVMAVLTGDSSVDPDTGTSFIEFILLALQHHWTVEVYAVKGTLSDATYRSLIDAYSDDLIITYLDDIYKSITYLVEGDYYFHDKPTDMIHVSQRIVSPKSW